MIAHHDTAERDLIACLILDPSCADRVAEACSPSDYGDPDLAALYDALLVLHQAGTPIGDLHLLQPALQQMRLPPAVTRSMFLAELLTTVPHAAHARHYAHEVRRASCLRRIMSACHRALEQATTPKADPRELASYLDQQLQSIHVQDEHPPERIGQIVQRVVDDLLRERPAGPASVMTGIASVDQTVGGWMPGELVLLAARPSVGKTALAAQIASYTASQGRPVAFASLEMTAEELADRYVAALTGIDCRRLRSLNLTAKQRQQIADVRHDFDQLPLDVWSPPRAKLAGIRAFARKSRATAGTLSLLVVDYVSLIQPAGDERRLPRHEQIAIASRGLKAIAKDVGCPVLVLCQLNRDAAKSHGKGESLPGLEHLAESDKLGQDADIALFLHRPEGTKDTKLIVAKHRNGERGVMRLEFDGRRTTFTDPPVSSMANYDRSLSDYAPSDF